MALLSKVYAVDDKVSFKFGDGDYQEAAGNGDSYVYTDTTSIHDIFGDGSAVATYQLDGDATDLGGNYDATSSLNGTITYPTGKFNQALKIENGYWNFDSNITDLFSPVLASTVSQWMLLDGVSSGNIISIGNTTGCNCFFPSFKINVGGTAYDRIFLGGDQCTPTTPDYVDYDLEFSSNLRHVVLTLNGDNTVTVYVDGNLVGTVTTTGWTSHILSGVITNYAAGQANTTKTIDQLKIFNRALTQTEVKELYDEISLTVTRTYNQLLATTPAQTFDTKTQFKATGNKMKTLTATVLKEG